MKLSKSDSDVLIRSSFSPRHRVCIDFTGEKSLTHQSFSSDCDINSIVQRYAKTGVLEHVSLSSPSYGDFSITSDYQSSLNVVIAAQESFMTLPSRVRARFANDPGLFLDFVSDPNNRDEAIKLGLIDESVQKKSLATQVNNGEGAKEGSTQLPT